MSYGKYDRQKRQDLFALLYSLSQVDRDVKHLDKVHEHRITFRHRASFQGFPRAATFLTPAAPLAPVDFPTSTCHGYDGQRGTELLYGVLRTMPLVHPDAGCLYQKDHQIHNKVGHLHATSNRYLGTP